ncbi:MAG: AAA family ATPase [candidate division Zixibacteria bacterium]|nr:AAA family ATPase [candidate division Zixibacteria bacterium]
MRLVSLELSGFRGFTDEYIIDLDAQAIIVLGPNGNGKTSLFDAILWTITGAIPRFKGNEGAVVSKFARTGQARTVLKLRSTTKNTTVAISRTFDGQKSRVSVDLGDGRLIHGPEAEGNLISTIWPEAALVSNPFEALATVLTRSVYLQQDLVREFIDSTDKNERFNAVSELVGAGRVTELQANLERERFAWSKSINAQMSDTQPLRARLSSMESRLAEIRSSVSAQDNVIAPVDFENWLRSIRDLGIMIPDHPVDLTNASAAIDSAIKAIDAARRAAERRADQLLKLLADINAFSQFQVPTIEPLLAAVTNIRSQIETTRQRLIEAQDLASRHRRAQAELKEREEQLRALAELALQHLGDLCPVCNQSYNIPTTRNRLQNYLRTSSDTSKLPEHSDPTELLLNELSSQERLLTIANQDLLSANQLATERSQIEERITNQWASLNLTQDTISELSDVVTRALAQTQSTIGGLTQAQELGERLALRVARSHDSAAIQELEKEIESTRNRLSRIDEEVSGLTKTRDLASKIISGLRETALEVVSARISEIEPLLSNYYGRIDVHPAFRAVSFLTNLSHGHGQLSAVVKDPTQEVECDVPGLVLSSSQMNALAVCVFLSLNLGVTSPPLDVVILDDPLQSLDDINLLGLIDLLRRAKDSRQVCISTHDQRFGQLLTKKLRPKDNSQRTVVIELEAWTRSGPTISTRDVKADTVSLRLALPNLGTHQQQ